MSPSRPATFWPTHDPNLDAFAPHPTQGGSELHCALERVGKGETVSLDDLEHAAQASEIPFRSGHRGAEKTEIPRYPTLTDLVRIGGDLQPDLLACGPDWALGPWADATDMRDPVHAACLIHACAVVTLSVTQPPQAPLAKRHLRRERRPPSPDRAGLAHLLTAPQSLWRLDEPVGNLWRITDLCGLHESWRPECPLDLSELPSLTVGEPQRGDTLCARVIPTRTGHRAYLGLRVRGTPAPHEIERWRKICLLEARASARAVPVEVALARHGHRMMRFLHEWAWAP